MPNSLFPHIRLSVFGPLIRPLLRSPRPALSPWYTKITKCHPVSPSDKAKKEEKEKKEEKKENPKKEE